MSHRSAQIEEIDDDGSLATTQNRFTEVEDEFDDDVDFELPELPSTGPSMVQDEVNPQGIKYVQDTAQFKKWSCLYPIYFDATKTTKQGRRVGLDQAVKNPLAKAIADAGKVLGFSIVFEPQKCHPADWSNPGRVRVEFKDDDGRPTHHSIRTKGQLNAAVAKYLRANPTQERDPYKVPVPGMEDGKSKRAAVPKGMKINDILPLHSPAMAGQGMAAEGLASMMGSMFPGMQGMLNPDEPSEPAPAPPAVTAPPKKPKMKRQIIR
ncbi:protein of unknown function [Taphrina deformans PYCC 5710]|uniref:Signal recognition particle, SRP19 subunit n=1 Tax=Taphrina deformans (strain PYCC 5710 / ATCC 11124 / CBS 356.35 / IMI 108563 / JCM 9778 / NBRC 8474) TaxID=1097556 RepID=R4XPA2_TAPDE|nr:protein of unknown function [Taphrina deformans PYCC 5710]|eukprot:CCG85075.1 protein of unknown function [Taphrina deformans PYCC 5710]